MDTQQVTIQVDAAMAQVVRAMIAKVEATGKTTADLLAQLEGKEQGLVLELDNGKTVVLQDGDSYQKMAEDADFADTVKAIRRGLADARAGRVKTLKEFDAEMRQKFSFLANVPEIK
jgi:predicted transcriptional regulator